MKKMKIVALGLILILLVGIVVTYFFQPRLIERAIYRMGFQEQVCDPMEKDENQPTSLTNFVVAGDFGVNENSLKTLQNMKSANPEIILFVGDLSYDLGGAEEWFDFTQFLENYKIYPTIGNMDIQEKNTYLKHYGLENPYYSFDYENIHFLSVSTDESTDERLNQIEFLQNDLHSASIDTQIDWIIVFMHKTLYSSETTETSVNLRNEFQTIFDSYGVDLVINAHQHAYERTKPLLFNNTITDDSICSYVNPNGQIYITVGTGGHSHSPFDKKAEWSVVQNDNDYGFLNISLLDGGAVLKGEFIANSGRVTDTFQISLVKNQIE